MDLQMYHWIYKYLPVMHIIIRLSTHLSVLSIISHEGMNLLAGSTPQVIAIHILSGHLLYNKLLAEISVI